MYNLICSCIFTENSTIEFAIIVAYLGDLNSVGTLKSHKDNLFE